MAEAARALEFEDFYTHGSAAPAGAEYAEPAARPAGIPLPQERQRQRQRAEEVAVRQRMPAISPFAIFGSAFVAILMTFAVLAQINYNEVAGEAVRLNAQLSVLEAKEKRLEITFESVVDMKEIERYARDELGMSRPMVEQVAVIQSMQIDKAEIIGSEESEDALEGLGSFLSSLAEYFKR